MDQRQPADDKRPTVAITTLGCKVNQYESAALASSFEGGGATLVPFTAPADIYVVNTCAVTAKAAAQSRRQVRRALAANPAARVVVTGCYAQVAARELRELGGEAVCVVGNGCKDRLVDIALAGRRCDLEMYLGDISRKREICDLPVTRFPERARAFLKVQDGCDRFCAYCIVPYARGPSRSLPPSAVVAQAERFLGSGHREIVLTGIHIGLYGRDLDPVLDLAGLVRRLLRLSALERLRISSLESVEITDELLDLMAGEPRLMPHLHIPLQAGDDRILAAMNRPYTTGDYRRAVERVVARLPQAAIGADVMVGFPGEDEEAFQHTRDFLASLPLAYLHVFPYSRRPGTVAAEMAGQVEGKVKDTRVATLRELDREKRYAFYQRFLGTSRPVLVERVRRGVGSGFTDNYIPVRFPAGSDLAGRVAMVRLCATAGDHVVGEVDHAR